MHWREVLGSGKRISMPNQMIDNYIVLFPDSSYIYIVVLFMDYGFNYYFLLEIVPIAVQKEGYSIVLEIFTGNNIEIG